MQAINLIFMLELLAVAYIDFKTFKVPLWALGFLLALGVLKGCFCLPGVILGGSLGFLLMVFSMIAGDWLLQRETIGGGDIWLGVVMSAFMGFDRFLIAYTVAALLGMVAMMTVHRKFQCYDMAYAPFLAAGAFWALFIAKI